MGTSCIARRDCEPEATLTDSGNLLVTRGGQRKRLQVQLSQGLKKEVEAGDSSRYQEEVVVATL